MTAAEHPHNVVPFASKPAASVIVVDPATAQRWLGRMKTNRNIRPQRVEQYTRDMVNGNWHLTGEPIKFDADGRLLDGQHRLKAIINAEATLHMFVVRGLADESQFFMDTGTARTPGDALGLNGESHAKNLAAASRLGYAIETNTTSRRGSISHALVFGWLDANPHIRKAVQRASCNDLRAIKLTVPVVAYCYYRAMLVDSDDAEEFFVKLGTRAECPVGSPVLALDYRLDKIREKRLQVTNRHLTHMVFHAFNAWRDGRSVKQIKLPSEDDTLRFPR